jgi:hypothetical protein
MASASLEHSIIVAPVAHETVRPLLAPHEPPCLSLYQPTHRNVPDNTVDQPTFRHLVESLEMALSLTHGREAIERHLHPFHLLADDRHFWQHTGAGLAMLASAGQARVFHLPRPVKPLASVAKRFHTLPLVRIAAASDRFHVLALTSREAHLYEGLQSGPGDTPQRLVPVPLAGGDEPGAHGEIVRESIVDAETFQPHRVQRGMGPSGLGYGSIVHGGTGSKQDDIDADTEIFCRAVDETVHERVSKHADLPLVLVALPRLAAVFRGLSKNRMLLEEFVPHDPKLLSPDDMAALVAPIFSAARQRRIDRAIRTFTHARDRDLAAGDLADIGRAAVAGRVATLLIEADRFETGRFDRATGAIATDGEPPRDQSRGGDIPAVQAEDLFGALAETVLLHGGGILSLERNAMPTETGVAAIYRY